MKVIIVTQYEGSFPFIDELLVQLEERGVEASVFDMIEMYTLKRERGEKLINYHVSNVVVRKICRIRFLGTLLRLLFYRIYLRGALLDCDHINIHYALPYYSYFINIFKRKAKSVSVVIWGSDFYRVSTAKRNKMSPIFRKSDSIMIPNVQLASDFSNFYKVHEKIRSVGFGIAKLDLIRELIDSGTKDTLRNDLKIPNSKLVIAVGYNGVKAQQHLYILEAFSDISVELKKMIFIVIPFGYGGDINYKKQIADKVEALGVEYRIFDSFISDIEVAKLRISSDLVINAQVTDGSSASLQEHLYAKNVLLVGEWLQYDHFANAGVKFWSFSTTTLQQKLIHVLNNFEDYREAASTNQQNIYNYSSWKSRINQWMKVYKNQL